MVQKMIVAAVTAVTSVAAFSESCYWQEYNGTYEGLFSESGRWTPKTPEASDNVYARSDNKSDSKIILDGDYTIGYLCLMDGSFHLAGSGSLVETSGTYKHIYAGHTLVVDGSVRYNAARANQYESFGTLRIAGGAMATQAYEPGPLTEICGGVFTNSSAVYVSGCVCRVSAGGYRTTGAMKFAGGSVLSVTGGSVSAGSGITFESGSVFALTNVVLDIGKATFAEGAKIRLGENAVLRLAYNSSVKTPDIEADPSAKIVLSVPAGAAAKRSCPVWLPAGFSVEDLGVAIETDGPEGWRGEMIGPCYFLTGTVATVPENAYEWTGAQDGYWSNPNNWHGGVVPVNVSDWVYISGERRTVITNDAENVKIWGLYVRGGTAPVLMRGNAIQLSSTTTGWNGKVPLRSDSSFPVVFENEVVFATQYGYSQARNSTIEHRGGVRQTKSHDNRFVWYHGTVYYGGTCSFRRLLARASSDCFLTFLPGADYTLTDQVDGPENHGNSGDLSYGGKLTMRKGAKLTVNGPWCQVSRAVSVIDGTIDFQGTLRGNQHWYGSGTVKTSGEYYTGVAGENKVCIGNGMTLIPASWNTEPAPGVVYRICATNGSSRLGAAGDWTYGAAEGASDVARALHIAPGATLTVDTEDPESGEGHTVAFADPISAEGSLVKAGEGTLALPAGNFAVGGSLALEGGVLSLGAPIEVAGDFVAAPDAALAFAGDILGAESRRTVLAAASISGVPQVKGPYRLRKKTNADTGREELVLMRGGMAVIVR